MLLRNIVVASSLIAVSHAGNGNGQGHTRTCTIPSKYESSNGTADYSLAIAAAFAKCSSNAIIEFKKDVDYNVFNPISALNLSNVIIRQEGNLHLPQNITYIQNLVTALNALTYTTALYWFAFAGPKIQYEGSNDITTSWINSYGQAWWATIQSRKRNRN